MLLDVKKNITLRHLVQAEKYLYYMDYLVYKKLRILQAEQLQVKN